MEQSNQTFSDYIEIILRRKWLILAPMVVGTAIAFYVGSILPSYYRSSTLIMVEQQQVPQAYVMPTDMTPVEDRLNTIKHQILSRTKLEQIIDEYNLYSKKSGGEGVLAGITAVIPGLGPAGAENKRSMQSLVGRMREDIEVNFLVSGRRRGGGEAFTISYSGKDPMTTMHVTNRLASLFIEENLKIREEYAEGTTEFLSSELAKAKTDLEKQEKALRDFKENNMGSLPEQLDANLRTLDRLQLELQNVVNSIQNAGDRKVMMEERLGMRPTADGSPALGPMEQELEDLRAELSRLLSVYKESYPDVIITKKRISELEQAVAAKMQRTAEEGEQDEAASAVKNPKVYANLVSVKSEIRALKKREADIRRQIRVYEKRVEDTPENEQRLADLRRDYDISLQNYKELLGKKLSSRLAENLEKRQKGERFKIIDPANLPESPYKPDRKQIALFGAAGGAGAGLGFVFLLEFLNPVYRKPEEVEESLLLPVLTVVPKFASKKPRLNS